MKRALPALGTYRTFEAAARLGGFTKAADELGVTPAAVSNQIRLLEQSLGVRLFERTSRSVRLTRAGEELLASTSAALDLIDQSVRRIKRAAHRSVLHVTASPSFATKWLVPRLERFSELFPAIDIRLDASPRMVDFSREAFDIGIRFGAGKYDGLRADKLFEESIFPVASPGTIASRHPLSSPRELADYALLHVDWKSYAQAWPSWKTWLTAVGAADMDVSRGPRFGHTALALEAAMNGKGIALAKASLVQDDLATGRLVRLFDQSLTLATNFAYYIVAKEGDGEDERICAFRDWVLIETCRKMAH